ncbi:MAG: hypothetical protein H6621_02935 [Halobacteriovoraceae bacterium]|nr:hypothetical protein [Halobacteriovoraceae bacterium]MCB9094000.1 hypothetical protein [Halobacteriovoraceae bacterium]
MKNLLMIIFFSSTSTIVMGNSDYPCTLSFQDDIVADFSPEENKLHIHNERAVKLILADVLFHQQWLGNGWKSIEVGEDGTIYADDGGRGGVASGETMKEAFYEQADITTSYVGFECEDE